MSAACLASSQYTPLNSKGKANTLSLSNLIKNVFNKVQYIKIEIEVLHGIRKGTYFLLP